MLPTTEPIALSDTEHRLRRSSDSRIPVVLDHKPKSLSKILPLIVGRVCALMTGLHWRRMLNPKVLFAWDNVSVRSSSTSWLDGLRGVAALQVFFFHFFGRHTAWGHTYGSSDEDYYLHQLPLVRSIWGAGSGAVSTFFVISGYAITVRSFKLLRQKNYEDLYSGLCSSLFRRGFRLYLPVFLLAIPTFFWIRLVDMSDGFLYPTEITPTWVGQAAHFLNSTDNHINPFSYKDNGFVSNRYAYVPTSWTIPMEYYGSLVCYLLMMILSRIDMFRTRAMILDFMCFYALHRGSWWTSNFLFGMLLADHTLEQRSKENESSEWTSKRRRTISTAFYFSLFMFGVYLAGMPPEHILYDFHPVPKPGYIFLYKLYPPFSLIQLIEDSRWWWYWSGNLTFLGISKVSWLQAIFNSKFCQWLGKLSFSLYLVHALVISTFSRPLQGFIKTMTEHKGIVCLFEFSVITPLIIILSGAIERYIDQPSVKFAKWLEVQTFRQRDSHHILGPLEHPLISQEVNTTNRPAE